MILQRAAVTVTLGPLALGLIYLGGWFVFVPLVVVMLIAVAEFGRMTTALQLSPSRTLIPVCVAAHYLVAQLIPHAQSAFWVSATLFISLLLLLFYALRHYESGNENASATFFASAMTVFLLGWMGSHIMLLRNVEPASGSTYWQWTCVTILATWGADIGAYLVGSFLTGKVLGRHLLTPRLSPKKTYEGYIGGVLIGASVSTLIGVFLFGLPALTVFTLAVLLGFGGTLGDLAISMLKRESGIKDSGNLFPGHGGALDRVDSLIWSFGFAYYFLYFFA